jgi:hypothetical protein
MQPGVPKLLPGEASRDRQWTRSGRKDPEGSRRPTQSQNGKARSKQPHHAQLPWDRGKFATPSTLCTCVADDRSPGNDHHHDQPPRALAVLPGEVGDAAGGWFTCERGAAPAGHRRNHLPAVLGIQAVMDPAFVPPDSLKCWPGTGVVWGVGCMGRGCGAVLDRPERGLMLRGSRYTPARARP